MADTENEDREHMPLNRGRSNNHTSDKEFDDNYLSSQDIHNIREDYDESEFKPRKYIGYSALGMRPSLNDSWDIDTDSDGSNEQGEFQGSNVSTNSDSEEDSDENCTGEFVSFWKHNGDGSSSSSQDDEDHVQFVSKLWRYPLPHHSDIVNNGDSRIGMASNLFHHKQKIGREENTRCASSSNNLTRSLGSGHCCCVKENGCDGYLLLAPLPNDRTRRWKKLVQRANQIKNESCPNKGQRLGDILSLPIIHPFLRSSGYTDRRSKTHLLNILEDEVDCNISENDVSDLTARRDHAVVIQSISCGIAGKTDNSLLRDANCESVIPIQNKRFLSWIVHGFNRISNQSHITQLHILLQKEDWSLATIMLKSNPELAQIWHRVDRLYDGKYGGAVLPIHAACAMNPPPSFIDFIANLYPEGLLEKDKAFDRVPLHVACRGVAKSGVIRVLCEIEPKCVDETDTYNRVPLHYLIKNNFSFGDDDGDIDLDKLDTAHKNETDDDGMNAMNILLNKSPNCVRVADHRGWLPLHVACSSSSRKGMIRVIKLLLELWPESINVKTEKGSDALACVNMAGVYHPTKERVIALLQEAK